MKIQIAQRFAPFTHLPGSYMPIPQTQWEVKLYPTCLFFRPIDAVKEEFILPLQLQGPVKNFTAILNCEKECIELSGTGKSGYFSLFIGREENALIVKQKKGAVLEKPLVEVAQLDAHAAIKKERLALGNHKKQDFELVMRRKDLTEILPIWYFLAQTMPHVARPSGKGGNIALFDACEKEVLQGDKRLVCERFLNLFQAAFEGVFAPRLEDLNHLGLTQEKLQGAKGSALYLLAGGKELIRALFFREEKEQYALLPQLSPAFHSGRMSGIMTKRGDEIAIEWSKKQLQKVVIRANKEGLIFLNLQKPLHSFRVRSSLKEKGVMQSAKEPLHLKAFQTLFLDRFQK